MPIPAKIPFRQYAAAHVEKAKSLLAQGEDALRYACLELRLAIEALAYETLQTYVEDDDPAVVKALKGWKPREVLEQLLKYDPIAGMSLRVEFRMTKAVDGQLPSEPIYVGTQDRFDAEWAGNAHHQMSQLLHQRTVSQIQDGKLIDGATIRDEAATVLERLEQVLASDVSDIRSDFRFGYDCPDPVCKGQITVATIALLHRGKVFTTCYTCNVKWRAESGGENNQPKFTAVE